MSQMSAPESAAAATPQFPTPPALPMAAAAAAPVGVNPVNAATKVRDIFILILAPFCFPAVLLAVARTSASRGIVDSFNLGEIAFGFVAVGIAAAARATTVSSDGWKSLGLIAIGLILLQTSVAIGVDDLAVHREMVDEVIKLGKLPDNDVTKTTTPIVAAAGRIRSEGPAPLQWVLSLSTGLLFSMFSGWMIVREH